MNYVKQIIDLQFQKNSLSCTWTQKMNNFALCQMEIYSVKLYFKSMINWNKIKFLDLMYKIIHTFFFLPNTNYNELKATFPVSSMNSDKRPSCKVYDLNWSIHFLQISPVLIITENYTQKAYRNTRENELLYT